MAALIPRQRSSAAPLALAYTALLLYASLYPFLAWRWPPGLSLEAMLALPWPPWRDRFDVWSNVLGYLPLGLLLYVAQVRGGRVFWRAALLALAAGSALSYATEVLQHFVPGRVPSRVDWALNSAGVAAGIALAAVLQALGLLQRWQAVRERWFVRDSAGALSLLALWPVGLLFPAPAPLGLGHVAGQLREWLLAALDDVPWAAEFVAGLQQAGEVRAAPLPPLSDALVQLLGLLAPCLVAFSVARRGWRRALLVAGVLAAGVAATTLSTALGFGPANALAWVTPQTVPALALGALLAAACAALGTRAAAGLGLVVLGALVVLVSQAPLDPYFAQSLQSWEQGRFIRFHGLALWIGWLWPYAAMVWLLSRLDRSAE
ncbi:MAG TPA: VanZ family protein [Rubrivivax sp.]|nr:VanZ family protein [Rubrivivax sp.]